jgi:CRISPR/Cas system-associated exonuclease Cas4 (RecB family)
MISFLERIAKHLYPGNGNDFRNHCLVFPNRRAGLFFIKYLAAEIKAPVWTPAILTINELFHSFSRLQPAENEILLLELFKAYGHVRKSPGSFDDFYFWGDMLLNDFDDVDKYLVDAELIFRNVYDIKKIDQEFGGLTPLQIEIIRKFWVNFNPEKLTGEKSGFLSIWSVLPELYGLFKSNLKAKGLGFEGMIFRDVVENADNEKVIPVRWKIFHFIGFNALNECEKALMTRLKKDGVARFYWDYDNSYIKPGHLNSAGFFMKENLKNFGNDMPDDWKYDTMLSSENNVFKRRVVEATSDVAQVKLIPRLIDDLPGLSPDVAHQTAVVLADENLLLPLLTSLPQNNIDVNITMGFPLKHSNIYTLVKNLLDLQRNSLIRDNVLYFNHSDVLNLLKNGLLSLLTDKPLKDKINEIIKSGQVWIADEFINDSADLAGIFRRPHEPALLSDYLKEILMRIAEKDNEDYGETVVNRNIRNEFIYRIMLILNRLDAISGSDQVSFTTDTWIRLFDRLLKMQSVPFSGEPLSGIQIMGILETRALDFRNLIILSVNEGVLPSVSTGSSFIPFSLREAFGLPSVNHQESIYAYHFYRLLQRAENVTFVYNSNSEGLRTGEMSRFLLQMKYEPVLKPDFLSMGFEIRSQSSVSEVIERNETNARQLSDQFTGKESERILSPSAINTWLNCRMKFYYRYVNRLVEPEKITADIDPGMLGSLLHSIMKKLYEPFTGQILTSESIKSIKDNRNRLDIITDNIFREKFDRRSEGIVSGNELIVREVLMNYLFKILETDYSFAPFTILNIEDKFSFKLEIPDDGGLFRINTGGTIDRVDLKDGLARIVDYKTGTVADTIKSVDSLFDDDRKKDCDGWLQTLLYCEAYIRGNEKLRVRPSIYKIRKLPGDGSSDILIIKANRNNEFSVEDYKEVRDEFMEGLTTLVKTIFSNNEPFVMTDEQWSKCPYCPYNQLCMR